MRTQRLTRARKSAPRETVELLLLDGRLGVIGDDKSAKDGSVSLLSGEAEERIADLGGLCTGKFSANIVTNGLDYALLLTGMRLEIGSCELEITRVGKSCYEACAIVQAGETCPLPKNCAFARVLSGGEIRTNDEITIDQTR
ncbi:MAG: MOSC domain-containing protein [Christensenella sp.]|nr:MOSC domain-containing protein [Christensenella sp.]